MKKKKRRTAAAAAATRKHSDAAASPQTQEQEAVVSPPLVETNSSSVSISKLEKNAPSVNNDGGRIQTDASPLPASEEPYHQPGADHDAARHDVDEAPDLFLSPQEATKVLERFFTVLMMANIPAHVALKPFCGKRLAIEKIEQVLQQAGLPSDFVSMELKAFRSLAVSGSPKQESKSDCSYTVEAQVIFDQASAIAFRVEMCEFQIRSAVCKYAVGAAKVPKAKMDFQRIVAKLTSHLPAAGSSTSAAMITSSDFERLLEEKLGVMLGSFLVKIVFARVIGRPFQRSFPKVLEANKLAFCEVLERFCISKPLSVDSVEGQLRQLVIKFPDMRAVFQRMDLDSSGTISTQEFIAFLQKEGNMHFPDEVLTAFIKRFDFDGDGTLSYDEFIEFVRPKQFGVNVLSPFGMFYLAVDRLEKMSDVVEKVKTRMFWLQHNDLFAVASAASSASTATASRVKGKPSQQSQQPTAKLKVTDRFILTHHFGARQLEFEPKDPIVNVLANGELVVLILAKDELLQSSGTLVTKSKSTNTNGRNDLSISPLPAFEYRLKPTTKRNLPPLFSTTEMMRSIEQKKLSAAKRKPSTGPTSANASMSIKSSALSVCRIDEIYAEVQRQHDWEDSSSSISCGSIDESEDSLQTTVAVSQTPVAGRYAHHEEPQNQMQTQQRDPTMSANRGAHFPPKRELLTCCSSGENALVATDSDSKAFEFFNREEVADDDADYCGDEALSVVLWKEKEC